MEWVVPSYTTNTTLTLVDEDNMSSDSATSVPSQQSVKAYADTKLALTGGTLTGSISDDKGNLRSIPSNAQSGAYVAVAADAGKAIYISTGGVTLNNSVFSAGDAVTIINNSGSDQTITQGTGVTMYNTSDAATGNRTLAGRGMATVWFAAASTAYISGAGLS